MSVAFVMRLLRQPLMTAYLIAGIVAGPLVLDLIHGDTELFDALAEFGVVLLLFVVGLSMNFEHIKRIGKVALSVGLLQFGFTAIVGFAILQMLGMTLTSSIYLGLAMTFSSTIVIVKLLQDKKDTESVYGRYTTGMMVVQDLLALFLLIILTSFNEVAPVAEIAAELLVKIVLLIATVYFLSRYVVPKFMDKVASSSEFLFIFTVAWCFGVASLLHWIGFSVEVGALVAGITLGSSPYQSEISSRVKPLRDFFIVMFFIILGSEFSLANIEVVWVPGLILAVFILLANPFILYHAFRRLRFTRRNSFLAGVTAAQVSEFGFILLFTGKQLGHVQGSELEIFTIIALVTIIISSYAISYNEQLYKFLLPVFEMFGKDKYRQREDKVKRYDIWLFGYHRVGWKIAEALEEKGVSFAVVDFNPSSMNKLHGKGIPAYFGDAADVEFLAQLPLEKAKMVISTLPEVDDQKTLITYIRKRSKRTVIIGNLYKIERLKELYKAGANYVMMPHMLGGDWIANILKEKRVSKTMFENLRREQRKDVRKWFSSESHAQEHNW